jgi:hypothetical protein
MILGPQFVMSSVLMHAGKSTRSRWVSDSLGRYGVARLRAAKDFFVFINKLQVERINEYDFD